MTPFFSIIVPIYKVEPYLRACVDSILAQTYSDFELILVDDGSPDGCGAICDGYAARDDRVRALHQPNAGPSPARRTGLRLARGAYVCFVDADDWVVPRWLEAIRGHIDQNGQPDMVLYDFFQVEGDEGLPDLFAPEGFYDKDRLEAEIYPWMLCDTRHLPDDPRRQDLGSRQLFPGYLWSKAFRRELICGHFVSDDRITVFEDVAMAYECAYFSRSVYISHEKLYAYRYLPQSNLRHYRPDHLGEIDAFFDYVRTHLGCFGRQYMDQLNVFCVRRLINCAAGELCEKKQTAPAARALAAALRRTRLDKKLSFRKLEAPMALFLLTVKLRLYLPAMLLVKLRMKPAGTGGAHG